MDEHIRILRKEELLESHGGSFNEENAERVVSWLIAAENQTPVVLVGAGFTLNALDRVTGKPATRGQAPLWADVVGRLAADLNVPSAQYDALTLFEMYEEAFGSAKLRDKLRSTVADGDLVPGDAHRALAGYACEAIVTMNCLDTLLDNACGRACRRVVDDEDLSCPGGAPQLIYLHGHRDFPRSWVMTRSQYEDLPSTKPVLVTRVRQLLAQHPWLVVGYSLTDPDFHAMNRLLGREMRGHQPLSLVLSKDTPSAPERQHWRRLGFEIASPIPKEREFGEFLAGVIPKLATTYSPTSEAAKAYILRAGPLERLLRFRQVNPAPIAERNVVFSAWEEQLGSLLTPEESESARAAAHDSARAEFEVRVPVSRDESTDLHVSSPARAVQPLTNPVLTRLAKDEGLRHHSLPSRETVRRLDHLLGKDQKVRAELAEYFAWGVEQRLFEHASLPAVMEVVSIHLAKDAGWHGERIRGLLRHAFATIRKYDDRHADAILTRQVEAMGLEVPPAASAAKEPHLAEAEAAYRAFMDADFENATKLYETAAKRAAAAGLDFETWVYTSGAADALRASAAPLHETSAPTSQQQREHKRLQEQTLRTQAERLAERPVVKSWRELAESRARKLLQESVEVELSRERMRATGTREMRWSGTPHALWRTHRDLEVIHASPWLQRSYAELLLPHLDASDMRMAMKSVAKPRAWLNGFLSRAPSTLSERHERDRLLVEAILSEQETATRTERMAGLDCARELMSVLRKQDLPNALSWLEHSARLLGRGSVLTAWDSRVVDPYLWQAFSAIARWAEPTDVLSAAQSVIGGPGPGTEGALKAFYDLPWRAWVLSQETRAGFLELLKRLTPTDELTSWQQSSNLSFALFALLRMIDGGLSSSEVGLDVEHWKTLLEHVKALPPRETMFSDARLAGFMLERAFSRLGLVAEQSTSDVFDAWFSESNENHHFTSDSNERWAALSELAPDDFLPNKPLLQRMSTELQRLVRGEDAIKHYRLNAHLAWPAVRLLTKGMRVLQSQASSIAPFLLQLLEATPGLIDLAADVMEPELWEESDWQRFKGLLVAACSGTGGIGSPHHEDPGLGTRCQAAVLSLFGQLDDKLRHREPALWYTLQGLALRSVRDERFIVANLAAFAVVKKASDVEGPSEAALYVSALQAIAADPRPEVRSAVANGGIRLAARARDEQIRQAAREAIEEVRQDPNARASWLLARAEAEEAAREATGQAPKSLSSGEAAAGQTGKDVAGTVR